MRCRTESLISTGVDVMNVVSPIRRGWVICAIALAHQYLGLDVADLPFSKELENIPKWITNCVEREWARNERLEPILTSTHDKRLLMHQIARRIPPEPDKIDDRG